MSFPISTFTTAILAYHNTESAVRQLSIFLKSKGYKKARHRVSSMPCSSGMHPVIPGDIFTESTFAHRQSRRFLPFNQDGAVTFSGQTARH